MRLLFISAHPHLTHLKYNQTLQTAPPKLARLEEFLPTIPEKDWGKAWEAISHRVPPLRELVTAAASGGFCLSVRGFWFVGVGGGLLWVGLSVRVAVIV